jgi:hypothetical protein
LAIPISFAVAGFSANQSYRFKEIQRTSNASILGDNHDYWVLLSMGTIRYDKPAFRSSMDFFAAIDHIVPSEKAFHQRIYKTQ